MEVFNGDYKKYYDYVKKQVVFEAKYMRIKRNFKNLGLWMVRDTQGKRTLNLFLYRIQF